MSFNLSQAAKNLALHTTRKFINPYLNSTTINATRSLSTVVDPNKRLKENLNRIVDVAKVFKSYVETLQVKPELSAEDIIRLDGLSRRVQDTTLKALTETRHDQGMQPDGRSFAADKYK